MVNQYYVKNGVKLKVNNNAKDNHKNTNTNINDRARKKEEV